MGATMATANALLKEIYEGKVREQLNNKVKTLRRIEKTSKGVEFGGRHVTFPIHTRRNGGIGARKEGELLPKAGQQGHAPARIPLRYQYGGLNITGQALKLATKDYQSFQSVLESETNGLEDDLALDLNRQVFGDGTGIVGIVTADAVDVNTIQVDRPDLFYVDMPLDYIEGDPRAAWPNIIASERMVTYVDTDNGTISVSGPALTVSVGGFFTRHGSVNREWTGLKSIIGTQKVYDIDPAIEPVWKSHIRSNGGTPRPVSEGLLTRLADDIDDAGGETTIIITTGGVRRAYANLLTQQRQFVNVKEFTGGVGGIAFITTNGEIPIMTDHMAPPGEAIFLNEKKIKVYREADWQFMDMLGTDKWVKTPGYDRYEAQMVQYSELGTERRNTHGRIEDLIEE